MSIEALNAMSFGELTKLQTTISWIVFTRMWWVWAILVAVILGLFLLRPKKISDRRSDYDFEDKK